MARFKENTKHLEKKIELEVIIFWKFQKLATNKFKYIGTLFKQIPCHKVSIAVTCGLKKVKVIRIGLNTINFSLQKYDQFLFASSVFL